MVICRVKIFQLNTLIFREMEHIIWNSEISAELRADRAYFTFPLFVWFLNSVCLNEAYKKAATAVGNAYHGIQRRKKFLWNW